MNFIHVPKTVGCTQKPNSTIYIVTHAHKGIKSVALHDEIYEKNK